MTRQWSKFDERGLARFVLPHAARRVRLPVNRADLLTQPDGRRKLIEAIYTALLQADIRYAPEQYHPEIAEQIIRSPSEILSSPGEGTCLDLAVLFAGICLGFELLPVVVVTETHALCAVSLTHGAPAWDSFDRRERQSFEEPLTDPAALTGCIDDGSFLAVECTGFAQSQSLPVDSIEGAGRQNGILPFIAATDAGRRQLERVDSPLRFAIDVAVAHYHWKMVPPILPADYAVATEELVAEQVAAGIRLDKASRSLEIRPYPRPVSPLVRPVPGFLDREQESAAVLEAMQRSGLTWLTGATGVGKTALLSTIAHEGGSGQYHDGVVFLSHVRNQMDGAQQAFDSFFESPPGYKPSVAKIGEHLRGLSALVMIDDSTPTAVDDLANIMLTSQITAVPDQGSPGGGTVVSLGGLGDEDALGLFALNLGREVGPNEQGKVGELCRSLNGQPVGIIEAARTVGSGAVSIDALLEESKLSSVAPSRHRYTSLDATEREIIDLLETFKDPGLLGSHIENLVQGNVESALSRLVADGAVATSSPRYRLAATAMGTVVDPVRVASSKEAATRYFEEWVVRAGPNDAAASLPEILQVMAWAHASHNWKTVVSMGMVAESAASLTRQWGLWGSILETTLMAARETGNRPAEAYALHQLGSRARLLGDRKSARSLLKEARAIRRQLGDKVGAQLSAHNLRFARAAWIPWLVGMTLIAALGAGAICGTTDLCEGDGPVGPTTPQIVLSPEQVDFAEIPVGAGGVEVVAISNEGSDVAPIGLGTTEGDPSFTVAGTDCPEVLEAGGRCEYTIAFTPQVEGDHNAVFGLDVEGADRISIPLTGSAPPAADVLIDPGVGEFGEVTVGEELERSFFLRNQGGQPAEITSEPVVDGEFFSIGATDCTGVLESGDSCQVNVLFAPERDLDSGTGNQIHNGVLSVGTDPGGALEAPLQGVSTFLLPDLTVDLAEATIISRELLGRTDMVVIRATATVRNGGSGPAQDFRVSAEQGSDGNWAFATFTDDSGSQTLYVVEDALGPGQEIAIEGFILVPRFVLRGDRPVPVRILVDSCAGEEFQSAQCRVFESNEDNNYAMELDTNPIVGSSEVALERNVSTLSSGDSNTANLVADAMTYYGATVSEETGEPEPIAAIVATWALLPPLTDPEEPIGPGDLYALQLFDIAPQGGAALLVTDDAGQLGAIFNTGPTNAPTGDFLHVSGGSLYGYCTSGDRVGLDRLILGDRTVVSTGVPEQIEPLPMVVTDVVAEKLGFPADGGSPRLSEMLRLYLEEALGGVVDETRYPEGGDSRYAGYVCID